MIDGSHSPYRTQEHQPSARWFAGTSKCATTPGVTARRTSRRITGRGAFLDRASGPREPNGLGLACWGAIAAEELGHWRQRQWRVPSNERHRGWEDADEVESFGAEALVLVDRLRALLECHTPILGNRTEASIRVPRMFKSHVRPIIWGTDTISH
jgi:hypothetical protein